MTQGEFGLAVGSSQRTAARWDAGQAQPYPSELRQLAVLLHPRDRNLASEVADAIDETLESLGLEMPPAAPPPPAPQAPPPPGAKARTEDFVDLVVLAAVEQSGSLPAAVRPWLHAAFKRAGELGLGVDMVESALRPASASKKRVP